MPFLSQPLLVSLVGGRGSHTAEDRLQASVLHHYFAGCFSVMNWICGGLGLFITGSQQELGALCMPPMVFMEDCSTVLNISVKHERYLFVEDAFCHEKICPLHYLTLKLRHKRWISRHLLSYIYSVHIRAGNHS